LVVPTSWLIPAFYESRLSSAGGFPSRQRAGVVLVVRSHRQTGLAAKGLRDRVDHRAETTRKEETRVSHPAKVKTDTAYPLPEQSMHGITEVSDG
jgi:hypothetical protein